MIKSKEEQSGGTVDWPFIHNEPLILCHEPLLKQWSMDEPKCSQNQSVVWIFVGQSTVPQLHSSLIESIYMPNPIFVLEHKPIFIVCTYVLGIDNFGRHMVVWSQDHQYIVHERKAKAFLALKTGCSLKLLELLGQIRQSNISD